MKLRRNWGVHLSTDASFLRRCEHRGLDWNGVFTYDKSASRLKEIAWDLDEKYLGRWVIVPEVETLEELL